MGKKLNNSKTTPTFNDVRHVYPEKLSAHIVPFLYKCFFFIFPILNAIAVIGYCVVCKCNSSTLNGHMK